MWNFFKRSIGVEEIPVQIEQKSVKVLQNRVGSLRKKLSALENEKAGLEYQRSQLESSIAADMKTYQNHIWEANIHEQSMVRIYRELKAIADTLIFLKPAVGRADPKDMTKLSKKPERMKQKLRELDRDLNLSNLKRENPSFVAKYEEFKTQALKYTMHNFTALNAADSMQEKSKQKRAQDRKINNIQKKIFETKQEIQNIRIKIYHHPELQPMRVAQRRKLLGGI